jgi:hypothetical protein
LRCPSQLSKYTYWLIDAPLVNNRLGIIRGTLGFSMPYTDLKVGQQFYALFENFHVQLMSGTVDLLVWVKTFADGHGQINLYRGVVLTTHFPIKLEETEPLCVKCGISNCAVER